MPGEGADKSESGRASRYFRKTLSRWFWSHLKSGLFTSSQAA
jgi:hypothetical protein